MRVLVVGSTGYLGRKISAKLVDSQIELLSLPRAAFTSDDTLAQCVKTMPSLDGIVNCAGQVPQGEQETVAETLKMFEANVAVPLLIARHLLPKVIDGGCFINISSILTHLVDQPDARLYKLSKISMNHLIESLAKEHPRLTFPVLMPVELEVLPKIVLDILFYGNYKNEYIYHEDETKPF
jgi:nucleoside-diphosphate-sugar epimerase